MRTHYDMQVELIEAARDVLRDVQQDGDTNHLDAFRRLLADSGRRLSENDLAYVKEIEEHASRFATLKADGTDSGAEDAEEGWLLDQFEIFNTRFRSQN